MCKEVCGESLEALRVPDFPDLKTLNLFLGAIEGTFASF